jgi:cation diffusion facilitator family transporter
MKEKVNTARLSIISNSLLILMKLTVGIMGRSVSIISEAIHSGMDLLAAIIAFFSVKVSDTPPDEEHPYGHGKYENVSGVIEAILIFIAAGWIILEAVKKLTSPGHEIEKVGLGTLVMFISAVVNTLVSRKLYKVAKKTDSIALEADALHLKTDVYTSLGVALGLSVMWLADLQVFGKNVNLHIIDPLIAFGVAVMILKESYVLLTKAYSPLLDVSLSADEITIIKEVFTSHSLSFHDLKTRKAGQFRFADLHLELPPDMELQKVHDTCDHIEDEIKSKIKNIELTIHVEPLNSK